ncbi:hypothetical protein OUZ56_009537 [Daphnia magna]|uniref:Uncharacterized protein n=1 Tax=Daphnia magna TaxID=35525 RepID=A0ABR0AG93_9CRUS|nr:hypothetical protein OUZ56_009537 [Daphnia magna]
MSFQVSSMLYRNCSSSSGNPAKEQEIYDEVQSQFDGYVTSIATTDEVEGEDYDGAVAIGGRQTFTAPAAILNDVAGEDFHPFAEHRISTIADREDEYRAMRWKLIISPERVDSFAEGGKTPDVGSRTYAHIIREQQLRAEEQEVHRKLTDKGWYIKSCIRTIGIITNSNHEFVLRSRLKTRSHQIKTDQQLTLL